jgi:hypothetical protein
VTEELIQRSPSEINVNGIANSTSPKAQIAALCLPSVRSAPRRQAIGINTSVASTTRLKARITGETSCPATLMKKYGSPQMIPKATKAAQPRHVTKTLPCKIGCHAIRDRRGQRASGISYKTNWRLRCAKAVYLPQTAFTLTTTIQSKATTVKEDDALLPRR